MRLAVKSRSTFGVLKIQSLLEPTFQKRGEAGPNLNDIPEFSPTSSVAQPEIFKVGGQAFRVEFAF